MQKNGFQTTKTNETPAKNWNMPFDVVVTQAHAHVHVRAGEDHLVGMLSIGGPSISAAQAVSSNKCPL